MMNEDLSYASAGQPQHLAQSQASMRVLEKCGFVREGVLRQSVFKDGEVIDSILYARVLKRENP
ncbi:MAG TPA: GNAT family protein [Thermoanaerobaculia bacterium]|nr:GNAT family protein [Thermoanaerobaculia bacterium]